MKNNNQNHHFFIKLPFSSCFELAFCSFQRYYQPIKNSPNRLLLSQLNQNQAKTPQLSPNTALSDNKKALLIQANLLFSNTWHSNCQIDNSPLEPK